MFQLYVLNEIADVPPQFMLSKAHFKEVNPIHTITLGGSSDAFVKFLIDARLSEDDITINSDKPKNIPPEMTLLSFKEYSSVNFFITIKQFNVYVVNKHT